MHFKDLDGYEITSTSEIFLSQHSAFVFPKHCQWCHPINRAISSLSEMGICDQLTMKDIPAFEDRITPGKPEPLKAIHFATAFMFLGVFLFLCILSFCVEFYGVLWASG